MKKLILISCLGWIVQLATGQSIDPIVLGSAGNYTNTGTSSIEFTVGELAISTLNSSGNIITQGFHQTYTGTSFVDEAELDFIINAYPNPTADKVNILMTGSLPIEFTAKIYDSYGRKIQHAHMSTSSNSKLTLDLTSLAAGTYFITLENSVNHLSIKTIQIQKL